MYPLKDSFYQLVKSEHRLKYILDGRRRTDPALQAEALSIVQRVFGGKEAEGGGRGEGGTRDIFEYSRLKSIARDLDFSEYPRKTRDGTFMCWRWHAPYLPPPSIDCCLTSFLRIGNSSGA